ncbi:MAG: hypothetical protein LBI18_16155, partial [Planctomycetaceae bacterium]|nr:hypothetical protein [Planctomycetaceae bacterium]
MKKITEKKVRLLSRKSLTAIALFTALTLPTNWVNAQNAANLQNKINGAASGSTISIDNITFGQTESAIIVGTADLTIQGSGTPSNFDTKIKDLISSILLKDNSVTVSDITNIFTQTQFTSPSSSITG